MSRRFEDEVLQRLYDIQETVEGTLRQKRNFTVKTESSEGITYTHDREHYLHAGLEVTFEEIQSLIEDIEDRKEKKKNFRLVK